MRKVIAGLTIAFLLTTTLILGWDKYEERKLRISQQTIIENEFPKYSVPVVKQWKGEFQFDNGVTLSNNFDGARLNGAALTNDSLITVLITPENNPVKVNPWYAFKIWSEEEKVVSVRFTYPEGITHRYYPKISSDGNNWKDLEKNKFLNYPVENPDSGIREMPSEATIRINTGPDPLWIAANDVVTTDDVETWLDSISVKPFISVDVIGESHQKKPIYSVKIETEEADKNIVILTRQYPSMSVGYLAMQSFISQITGDTEKAENFRSEYNVYLFPHINPDGADQGHWSHNMGGVNLTEDWGDSKQPETKAIKAYIDSIATATSDDFYLNIDFRSNRESILYVYNADTSSSMKGLTMTIAESVDQYLSEYTPAVKTRESDEKIIVAEDYFYHRYGMESLVVIIQEDSSDEAIDLKGRALSSSVMEHLMTL